MKYVTKPVLVRRKQNVTGSLSFGRQIGFRFTVFNTRNKYSDACIYLPPYKLDVLNIVEYKFSCEMEAHVEVTTSLMFDCNTFKDKRHLLILVAITLPCKELQFCNFIMQ